MQLLEPKKIVLIGASTGGPGQVCKIVKSLPPLYCTAVVVAQHMADGFIQSFANTLHTSKHKQVAIANNNTLLQSGRVYLCEKTLLLDNSSDILFFRDTGVHIQTFNPDINVLFNSFVKLTKEFEILSVILTGIGDDGVKACQKLSLNGSQCITETSQSAIIDGMPARARERVENIGIYNMDEIIKIICEFCE